MHIRVLGCSGSIAEGCRTTAFLLDDDILIDAGNANFRDTRRRVAAELITDLAAHDGADVVLPWDGRDHYLAGVYRTGLADRGDALVTAGERSMRSLVDTVNTQRIVMAPTAALTNVNTPVELVR